MVSWKHHTFTSFFIPTAVILVQKPASPTFQRLKAWLKLKYDNNFLLFPELWIPPSQSFLMTPFFPFSRIAACALKKNSTASMLSFRRSVRLTLLHQLKCTMSTFASNTELSFSEWGIIVFKSVFNLSRHEDYAAKSPFRAVSSPPTPLP